jgi:hypothetical protein
MTAPQHGLLGEWDPRGAYFTGKIQDGGIQASSFALIKNQ